MTVLDTRRPDNERRDLPPSMVERMTLILDAFEGRSARLTLEDVAGRTRLPRSTAHRILDQLVRLRWLEHGPHGYGLGPRALGLGGGDSGHTELRRAAAPVLHELQMRTGMVVHLGVLEESDVLYLDKVGGRFASVVPSRVGGRVAAHTTAIGKALLAWVEPERVDELMEARDPNRPRPLTLDALHQELNRVRQRRGLAFERGESIAGVACVAAAIRGPEGAIAAISLCGDARSTQLERVAPLIIEGSRAVARELWPDMFPAAVRTGRSADTRRSTRIGRLSPSASTTGMRCAN